MGNISSMKYFIYIIIACLLVISCEGTAEIDFNTSGENIVLRNGSSFGFCDGYCIRLLEIKNNMLTYTKSSRDNNLPLLVTTRELTSVERNNLYKSLDLEKLYKMNDTYGCPDCADGGAEWVEVSTNSGSKRITFEYGTDLPDIQPFLDNIRTLRKIFENN